HLNFVHSFHVQMTRRTAILTLSLSIFFASCGTEPRSGTGELKPIDASKIRFSRLLQKNSLVRIAEDKILPDQQLVSYSISDSIPVQWQNRLPHKAIENEILLKFVLYSNADTSLALYFYPGAYFKGLRLIRYNDSINTLTEIDAKETEPEYRKGFRLIRIEPKDSSIYFARLIPVRTSVNLFYPALVQKDFIGAFIAAKKEQRATSNIVTYVATGIMLMMILYSMAVFVQNGGREFLYYAGYAFCMGLLLFLKSFLVYKFSEFNFFFESYWDLLILCAGVGFYFFFLRKFLNTKSNHPFLDKTFKVTEILVGTLLIFYTILFFSTNNFYSLDLVENFTKQLLLIVGIVFIIYGIRKNDKLLRYLLIGNALLSFFSIVSFVQILFPFRLTENNNFRFLNEALFYYEVGLIAELAFFLIALAYKNHRDIIQRTRERERLTIENERKELEKQMAVLAAQQDERNRISADMHDELGSGVTAIRLMSEIVKTKMKESALPEIDKISNSANDLITKMNTIIWTMTSSNDTVENLITYIRTYAIEFFENTNIECDFNMPEHIPSIELTGERRRNIFLAVKEAMNNVLKHAKASKVQIDITITDKLIITIADNGGGIDFEKIRKFGNGLKNMQARLENINGLFEIRKDGGTVATFEIIL
ncbi:MAG TPA: sensor histidine kinase, partial [Chitinophagaceae bacterium]|nr:sensor histidine kinase [Chitinophagaceae bacterium]